MSVRLMAAVFELEDPAVDKLVMLALADHARDDGTGAYPSVALLARKTSLSRRGVQKTLRRLEGRGRLEATANFRGGRELTTEYRMILERNSEPGSLFSAPKGRTSGRERANVVPERANLSAEKGEPGSPQPSGTVLEPSVKQTGLFAPASSSDTANSWIPIETWARFVEMRRLISRPLTGHAVDLAMRKLESLKAEGNDPVEVLEQSILNSWTGLWPISRKGGTSNGINRSDRGPRGAIAPPAGKYDNQKPDELSNEPPELAKRATAGR